MTRPLANVLLLPALGTAADYYTRLAEALRGAGFRVAVMELRGHGNSPVRPSRRVDFGFRELLDEDLPAALRELRADAPELPTILFGHSLGGHLAAISAGRLSEAVDGIVLTACGSPWMGAYRDATLRKLKLLCAAIPPLTALLGYYPGQRIGFGGREARTLMREWRALALSNRYSARGIDEDLDGGIAEYDGPVLALRMGDDDFAPEAAVHAVTDKFRKAGVQHLVLDAETLDCRADHFRWARQPDAVVHAVTQWFHSRFAAEALRA